MKKSLYVVLGIFLIVTPYILAPHFSNNVIIKFISYIIGIISEVIGVVLIWIVFKK